MYPGPAGTGPSPQPTPNDSPQLPVGRTPSPGDYQPQPSFGLGVYSGYGQQPYAPVQPVQPSTSMSIPTMRSVPLHLAGGSCTTTSNFTPVPLPQQEMVVSVKKI